MTKLVLLCFRDINSKQKEISNETLDINMTINKIVNDRIKAIHNSKLNDLPPDQKNAAINEISNNTTYMSILNRTTDRLDIDDPSTEPLEMRLDRLKLEREAASSIKVGNIITEVVGDLGPYYN